MNRTDSAIFRAGRFQLFHSAKMDSIRPLSSTFGNGRMGFFHSASSFSIRPKSAKMADKSVTWQPWSSAASSSSLRHPPLCCALQGATGKGTKESRNSLCLSLSYHGVKERARERERKRNTLILNLLICRVLPHFGLDRRSKGKIVNSQVREHESGFDSYMTHRIRKRAGLNSPVARERRIPAMIIIRKISVSCHFSMFLNIRIM
jgi:hypothetical protein